VLPAEAELVRNPLSHRAAQVVQSEVFDAGTPPNGVNWPGVLASVTRLATGITGVRRSGEDKPEVFGPKLA
jgi:hypothetical protein